MIQLRSDLEEVVDTVIALTRLSKLHRAIIAGSDSMELYLVLRRRGFIRIATPATCPIPKGLHAVGLVTGQSSPASIERALALTSPFLAANAAIGVVVNSCDGEVCLRVRKKLQEMGFRIEAGVRCQRGLVLSAYRQGFVEMERAA